MGIILARIRLDSETETVGWPPGRGILAGQVCHGKPPLAEEMTQANEAFAEGPEVA
jgi:hypothetical protein